MGVGKCGGPGSGAAWGARGAWSRVPGRGPGPPRWERRAPSSQRGNRCQDGPLLLQRWPRAARPTAPQPTGFTMTLLRPCNPITGPCFQDRPFLHLPAETFWKLQALASEAPALRGLAPRFKWGRAWRNPASSFVPRVLRAPLQLWPQIVTPALRRPPRALVHPCPFSHGVCTSAVWACTLLGSHQATSPSPPGTQLHFVPITAVPSLTLFPPHPGGNWSLFGRLLLAC